MPADILGSEVLETAADGSRAFRFIEGPIFCQLLMADEINRASPRTQSALLQAMQEREVTIAGQHRPLGAPFHVLATQNPIEQEGTYPLPEAQLDRFLVQIDVPYPDRATEREILLATTGATEVEAEPVFTAGDLLAAQALLRRMPVGDKIVEMILDLVRACRPDAEAADHVRAAVSWGPGPRAAQALMLTVRAEALLDGRLAPSPEDVRRWRCRCCRTAWRWALPPAPGPEPAGADRPHRRCRHKGRGRRVSETGLLRTRAEALAAPLPALLARGRASGRKRAFWASMGAAAPGRATPSGSTARR